MSAYDLSSVMKIARKDLAAATVRSRYRHSKPRPQTSGFFSFAVSSWPEELAVFACLQDLHDFVFSSGS